MEHYVGLDVSLKLTAICIVDQTGKIEREGVVASDPETIATFVKSHAPHVARVGLETGATSTWLWTEREARRAKRIAQIAEIAKSTPALPHGRFPIIYADAPWKMNLDEIGSLKSFEAHYPTMDLAEIAALPVADIATPDAALFLWSIPAMLPEALEVMSAWGFTYVSQIVWVKDKIGLGYWVRYQHELLLIGRRGNIPTPPERERPPSVINAPRREHSRKPDEAYELIERMYPELPKIELFARQTRAGWAAWGNEIAREAADFRSANRRGSASSAPAAAPG
jgi:N6-adenosine-specific RNA methylase IME4